MDFQIADSMDLPPLNARLHHLGMDWNHPRVTAFLDDCRRRYGRDFPTDCMPQKVADRLSQILTVYEGINSVLRATGSNCDKPEITSFIHQHSKVINGQVSNRML